MADRGMGAAPLAEVQLAKNRPVHLLKAEFDAGDLLLTDAFVDIVYGGETYSAAGQLLGFEPIRESARLEVSQTVVQLTGVDRTMVSVFLEDDYLDRRLRLWKTFLNSDGTAMTPVLIFDGRMDGPAIEENTESDDGACNVAISATSQFGDFTRRPGRRTNSAVQELFYPEDRFFDFCAVIPGQVQAVWGRAAP